MKKSKEWNGLDDQIKAVIMRHHAELPIAVGSIAKDFGLIVKKSTLRAGISGEIKKHDNAYLIRVNRHDVKARQRFTIAHEIAHYLLHQDLIGDGISDDILYRSRLSDQMEAQANRLIADLLMPWELLKPKLEQYGDNKMEMRVEMLAEDAQVSTTAINIRLGRV